VVGPQFSDLFWPVACWLWDFFFLRLLAALVCRGNSSLKKNLRIFLGFQIPPIFCISQLSPSKRILNFFFGFSDPANFLLQPASSLKKNLKFFFGFSDPANFLHQPAFSLKKNLQKES
jgi:hypothetical protein